MVLDATAGVPGVERDACGNIQRVLLSARTGDGLDALRAALAETIFQMPASVSDIPSVPVSQSGMDSSDGAEHASSEQVTETLSESK